MAYINKLGLLTEKSADMDSLNIVRELKRKVKLPLTEQFVKEHFSQFLVRPEEIELLKRAQKLLEQTITEIRRISELHDKDYEAINVARAANLLIEIEGPLNKQIEYAEQLLALKDIIISDIFSTLGNPAKSKDKAELQKIYAKILRSDHIHFKFDDIIYETHDEYLAGLLQNMPKGYIFHFSLEDTLNKLTFEQIKPRIAREKLESSETLLRQMAELKGGIGKALEMNMRTVQLFLNIHSLAKAVNK